MQITTEQKLKVEALKAVLPTLSGRDQVFAASLVSQGEKYILSSKQMYWVEKLAGKVEKPVVAATIDNVKGVLELLSKPGSRLKYPKIRILVSLFGFDTQSEFTIALAGEKARFPGSINVTSGKYPDSKFYGRIHTDGSYEPARGVDAKDQESIITELKKLAADPEGVAKEFGKKTGRCCFCSLHLDDERSVAEGYGPVCAKHYNLSWGGRKPKIVAVPVESSDVKYPGEEERLSGRVLVEAAARLAGVSVDFAQSVYRENDCFDGEPTAPSNLVNLIRYVMKREAIS